MHEPTHSHSSVIFITTDTEYDMYNYIYKLDQFYQITIDPVQEKLCGKQSLTPLSIENYCSSKGSFIQYKNNKFTIYFPDYGDYVKFRKNVLKDIEYIIFINSFYQDKNSKLKMLNNISVHNLHKYLDNNSQKLNSLKSNLGDKGEVVFDYCKYSIHATTFDKSVVDYILSKKHRFNLLNKQYIKHFGKLERWIYKDELSYISFEIRYKNPKHSRYSRDEPEYIQIYSNK